MSIKLHNGFILHLQDIFAVQKFFEGLRCTFTETAKEEVTRWTVEQAVRIYDDVWLGNREPSDSSAFSLSYRDYMDRRREVDRTKIRDVEIDFDFSISLVPHLGIIYGLAFCEQHAWLDRFMSNELIEPFPYWDNTDGPVEVEPKEWQRRRQLWTDILGPNQIPALAGFSADVVIGHHVLPDADYGAVARLMPDVGERRRRAASNRVASGRVGSDASASAIVEIVAWMGSAEGQEAIVEEAKSLELPEMDAESLFRPLYRSAAS